MYDMDFRKTLYVVSSHQNGVGSSGDNFVFMFVVGNIVSETKFLKSAMFTMVFNRWHISSRKLSVVYIIVRLLFSH